MDLRGALERHAASTALRTGAAPVEQMRDPRRAEVPHRGHSASARKHRSCKGIHRYRRRFHQTLIDAAGSELLSSSYARLRTRQLRAGSTALSTTPDRQQSVCHEHEAIVTALAGGDEALVHKAIDEHLQITPQALLMG